MGGLFSISGKMRRLPYLFAWAGLFAGLHLIVVLTFFVRHQPLTPDVWFWFTPLRSIAFLGDGPIEPMIAMAGTLVCSWVWIVLTFKRARDAGLNGWAACLAIVPFLQILVMLLMSVSPSRAEPPEASDIAADVLQSARQRASAAALGAITGSAVMVAAVALSTLVFGVYGYGLFVIAPVVVGAVAGYVANRRQLISDGYTAQVALAATAIAALALIGLAMEGVICLLLASPLIAIGAWIGGVIGRALVRAGHRSSKAPMLSIAILPAIFAGEHAIPSTITFTQAQTVEIAASPVAVWAATIQMHQISQPPPLPFRLGLAYALRGEIIGQGPGAIRHGYFSTGMATERVTEWAPGQVLAFDILSDPPSMSELSPYAHMTAPHDIGYFKTLRARFTLVPDGVGTRVTLTTVHTLDLEPALYWLPLTRWAIHENKARVLGQIARQAEATPASE